MNEKVDIEIFKRRLTIELEGFTPMEITALADQVTVKMREIQAHNEKMADTSKIATLAALLFAADLWRLREKADTEERVMDNTIEKLSLVLQSALSAAKAK